MAHQPTLTPETKNILDQLHEAIVIVDSEGKFLYVNGSYEKMTDLSFTDIQGIHIGTVRPGSKMPQVLETGKALLGIYRTNNNVEYISNILPLFEEGVLVGGISTATEAHDVIRISKELENSQKLIRTLQNSVKHPTRYHFDSIIAAAQSSVQLKEYAKKLAKKQINVLIEGESGTGKELYAQSIHNESAQRFAPFLPVNCATLEANLLEAELFGYEDGAFTGAKKGGKRGIFEEADGGTVFLDEIGELDQRLQVKLLRTLQESTIRRVGGTSEIKVNVRILSATNRDLKQMVQEERFRLDLYYRLAQTTLTIPPLRERQEDIAAMIDLFLAREFRSTGKKLAMDDDAMALLKEWHWPGNVRELQNVITVGALMAEHDLITIHDLPRSFYKVGVKQDLIKVRSISKATASAEATEIKKALLRYGQDTEGKRKAAKSLGISLSTLYNKMKLIDKDEL